MVRSSQYGMKKPSSDSNDALNVKRTWPRRLLLGFVLVLIASCFWLATPAGQRFAVRYAVAQLNDALPESSLPLDVSVASVGLGFRPIGVQVQDLILKVDAPNGDTLLSVLTVRAQPNGLSLTRWNAIHIEGATATGTMMDVLEQWTASSDSSPTSPAAPTDFELSSLTANDVSWSFDSLQAGFVTLDQVHIRSLRLSQLEQSNGHIDLGGVDARIDIRASTTDSETFGYAIKMNGTADTWNAQVERTPGPVPVWEPYGDDWCPDVMTVQGQRTTGLWALSLANSHIQIDSEAAWRSDSLRFNRLEVDAQDLADWSPSLPPFSAALTLVGPLVIPLTDTTHLPGQWDQMEALGTLSWEITTRSKTGHPASSSGLWTPQTGQVEVAMDIDSDCFPALQGHGPALDVAGFVPSWPLSDKAPTASLYGSWQLDHRGNGNGLNVDEGNVSLAVSLDSTGLWRAQSSLGAQLMPLAIGETLDLQGQLSAQASVAVDSNGRLSAWSCDLDIAQGKWFPHLRFGARPVKSSPPLPMRKFEWSAAGDSLRFNSELDGDFLRGTLSGPMQLEQWIRPFETALASGGFTKPAPQAGPAEDWSIDIRVLRDDLLERFSAGTKSVGPYSKLVAANTEGELRIDLRLTALHWGALKTRRLNLNGRGSAHALTAQLDVNRVQVGEWTPFESLELAGNVDLEARSSIGASWTGPVEGQMQVNHQLYPDGRHVIHPTLASFQHASGDWRLDTLAHPELSWPHGDWRSLTVDHVDWIGSLGAVSIGTPDSSLLDAANFNVSLNGVPLETVSEWTAETMSPPPPPMKGTLNGDMALDLTQMHAFADVQWQDASIGAFGLGDLCVSLLWDDAPVGTLQQFIGDREVLSATTLSKDKAILNFKAYPVETLNPLLAKGEVEIAGSADGSVALDWSQGMPLAEGDLTLDAHSISIGATGGQHSLNGVLRIDPDFIGMDQAIVLDADSNQARLNLSVLHTDFADWNYDLGLSLEEEPFRVMDLPPLPSRLFYGAVMATGNLDVFGDESGLFIEAEVKSQAGTQFTLPLDALEGAGMPSGIRFVGSAEEAAPPEPRAPFGLTLDLELDVTPDAQLALVLDSEAGERVDGRAEGHLAISMDPEWPLSIEGGLTIQEGHYRFSLRDLFTKRIEIAQGGQLNWNGNPYSAEFNLLALSNLRANPKPILPGIVDLEKTAVQVGMGIHGILEAPELDFVVRFPQYEASNPSLLIAAESALSAPEEMERQAFALLASGQFIPRSGDSDMTGQSVVATQASELVSSKVSELLSGLSEDVDIGLRYVPSAIAGGASTDNSDPSIVRTEDAIELDLGVNLMNDRLRISGTLGAQGGNDVMFEDFRGGVDVHYKLTPDGRWELLGYQMPLSNLDQEDVKRGIGAAYQIRFNQLRELFRRDSKPKTESP